MMLLRAAVRPLGRASPLSAFRQRWCRLTTVKPDDKEHLEQIRGILGMCAIVVAFGIISLRLVWHRVTHSPAERGCRRWIRNPPAFEFISRKACE